MNKTVVITGGNGNLGSVVVDYFLMAGYSIISIVSKGKGSGAIHSRLKLIEADLSDEKEVINAFQKIQNSNTQIHAAILLAGGYAGGSIEKTDGDAIQKMIDLNFYTCYHPARAAFLQMSAQSAGGRLIFIGARPALVAAYGKGSIAYGLSKAMVIKLAEYFNAEGQQHNVQTHVIVPSTIDTPANRAAMPQADFNTWVKPDNIAETILFLCSEASESFRDTVIKMYNRA